MSLIDNFDTYNDGDLAGQGSWANPSGYSSGDIEVQASVVRGGSKAMALIRTGTGSTERIAKAFTAETDGTQVFYFRFTNTTAAASVIINEGGVSGTPRLYIYITVVAGKFGYNSGGLKSFADVSVDTWYKATVEWRTTPDKKFRVNINDGTWSDWLAPYSSWTTSLDTIMFDYAPQTGTGTHYFDTFSGPGYTSPLPAFRRP